jgi:hypothetical protein
MPIFKRILPHPRWANRRRSGRRTRPEISLPKIYMGFDLAIG